MVFTPFAYTYFLQVFYSDLPSLLLLLITFSIIYFGLNTPDGANGPLVLPLS
ncbi:Uncharacterised protein [Weissella viridescens]|uniref:Uncharacterized protein n=1 Tax=Weissella viridescens TaxID=1629 RepID=A0A380P1R0_WEIVI|nr:Uncharacterised protein [Weissella viridescens]